MTKKELKAAIAVYDGIDQEYGMIRSEDTTLGAMRRDGATIITQTECKKKGLDFPDDECKVSLCGYVYDDEEDDDEEPIAFWLYKQGAPIDDDEEITVSFSR